MNLLVTGAWRCTEEDLNKIRAMGHEIQIMPHETKELPCDGAWVEGVICNCLFLNHSIEEFPNLRYIQLLSAGLDRVPLDYIRERGIVLRNAKAVYSGPMAEFAIGGVLQIYKKARLFAENQRQHIWKKDGSLLELAGKTVLIVGCGDVGRECAKRFAAFGCEVIGVNRSPVSDRTFFDEIGKLDDLDEVLGRADIVVVAVAITSETRHLLNAERLEKMKTGAVLVNVARGPIIDESALVAAAPRLGGIVLDVFEEEPLGQESPLWDLGNVILTPHNSFVGDGNAKRMNKIIFEGLKGAAGQ